MTNPQSDLEKMGILDNYIGNDAELEVLYHNLNEADIDVNIVRRDYFELIFRWMGFDMKAKNPNNFMLWDEDDMYYYKELLKIEYKLLGVLSAKQDVLNKLHEHKNKHTRSRACVSCSRNWPSHYNFCSNCGISLK